LPIFFSIASAWAPLNALRGARVLVFADRDQASFLDDEPTVSGRIGKPATEGHNAGACGQRPAHALDRCRRDERRVGVKHDDVVRAVRDRRAGGKDRVRGAEALGLLVEGRIGGVPPDEIAERTRVGPDDHCAGARARL
jgi:hypothetical protein